MNLLRLFLLVSVAGLAGCFSLGRDAPVEKHFVLGGNAMPDTAVLSDGLTGLRIGIRQLQLAEYLESPLIVVRQGPHRIEYSEFNRWGGTLSSSFNYALAGYLKELSPLEAIDVAPWPSRATHDYLIQVHLLHLEGLATEEPASLDGGVHLMATWEIINPQDGAELARGTTNYRIDGWTVGDYGALVELFDAGLWELARDLATSLAELPE